MTTLKYSRQRESIKNYLATTKEHPTADTVYLQMKKEFPNISLGTVYRNLNLLVEMGEIRKLSCGDSADHFDGDISPHYHFVCRSCGAVSDLPMEISSTLNDMASQHTKGHIENHTTYFYGTCEDCLRKTQKEIS